MPLKLDLGPVPVKLANFMSQTFIIVVVIDKGLRSRCIPPATGNTDGLNACLDAEYMDASRPLTEWVDALNGRWRSACEDWARRPSWNDVQSLT